MADAAKAANVAGAIRPPEYRKAVQLIRTIDAKKEKIASVNGEIGDVWAKVEGHRVNKAAGKFFAKLDKLEPADRLDVMRSFNGLADAAGWNQEEGDLVDGAQGNVVDMRMHSEKNGGDGAPPSREEALERAKGHLGTADAPDATDGESKAAE